MPIEKSIGKIYRNNSTNFYTKDEEFNFKDKLLNSFLL